MKWASGTLAIDVVDPGKILTLELEVLFEELEALFEELDSHI